MRIRTALTATLIAAANSLAAWPPSQPASAGNPDSRPKVVVTEEALRIHRSALVADGHNDLAWQLRTSADPELKEFDISQEQPSLHTDIPRLLRGGVDWQFWSAYVPAESRLTGESLAQTLEQIELIRRLHERYPDVFELASTADDVERINRAGKIASMIGIEGGHSIQNSLAVLRQLYLQGARYMTLTHSDTLDWADSATDEPRHGGLAPFGEEVVREMNRLGMLVDISHVSPETMHDVLRVSRAPVIASHSSAYAIAPHPRNVPDDVLRLIAGNGGLVMVNFFSGFIVPESARILNEAGQVRRELRARFAGDGAAFEREYRRWRAEHPIQRGSVHVLVDHIDHIVKVAGIDHAGLGSDFDGVTELPEQLEDVSCYPAITQELLNRGYAEADIRKILGGNLLAVLRRAEAVAREMTGEPRGGQPDPAPGSHQ